MEQRDRDAAIKKRGSSVKCNFIHNTNIFHNAVRSPTCRLTGDKLLSIPFITAQRFNTLTERNIKTNKTIPANVFDPSCHTEQ